MRLVIRKGTQAELDSILLLDGELGYTTDTKMWWIGRYGINERFGS